MQNIGAAPSKKKRLFTGFGVFLLFVLAFALFMLMNFHTVVVSGVSMEKTFHTGDKLLVTKAYWLVGPIKKKDIVVVTDSNPDGYIIKRVYALGGEKVEFALAPRNHKLSEGEYVVPEGELYILGDNREQSEDSRAFGSVPRSKVIGKVVVVRW